MYPKEALPSKSSFDHPPTTALEPVKLFSNEFVWRDPKDRFEIRANELRLAEVYETLLQLAPTPDSIYGRWSFTTIYPHLRGHTFVIHECLSRLRRFTPDGILVHDPNLDRNQLIAALRKQHNMPPNWLPYEDEVEFGLHLVLRRQSQPPDVIRIGSSGEGILSLLFYRYDVLSEELYFRRNQFPLADYIPPDYLTCLYLSRLFSWIPSVASRLANELDQEIKTWQSQAQQGLIFHLTKILPDHLTAKLG